MVCAALITENAGFMILWPIRESEKQLTQLSGIDTNQNPADHASREKKMADFMSSMWLTQSKFLRETEIVVPKKLHSLWWDIQISK